MNGQFSCSDKETLIAYVYGECDAGDREAVEAHLATCAGCAGEVAGLGGVREALDAWSPPEHVATFRLIRDDAGWASRPSDVGGASGPSDDAAAHSANVLRPARWWRQPVGAFARVAAGVLLFAGGLGLANLNVHYGPDGLTVRTGWQQPPSAPAAPVAQVAPPGASSASAPWRSDLAALERQLRGDFSVQLQAVRAAAPQQMVTSPGTDERRILTQVRSLVASSIVESEQRQDRQFATRVAQLQGEWGLQRQADLVRLQQGLGYVGQTGAEVAQQRRLLNYLLTVSQRK